MAKDETLVVLTTKKRGEKGGKKKQSFPLKVANRLLTMRNAKWELDDKNFTFNGVEISKAKKETATPTPTQS